MHIKHVKKKSPWTIKKKIEFKRESSVQFVSDRVHISIKTGKQETETKRSICAKLGLKNLMYTSAFNDIFAKLIVNDKEEFLKLKLLKLLQSIFQIFLNTLQKNFFMFAVCICSPPFVWTSFSFSFLQTSLIIKEQEAKGFEPELSITRICVLWCKIEAGKFKIKIVSMLYSELLSDLYFRLLYRLQSRAYWKQKFLTANIVFREFAWVYLHGK